MQPSGMKKVKPQVIAGPLASGAYVQPFMGGPGAGAPLPMMTPPAAMGMAPPPPFVHPSMPFMSPYGMPGMGGGPMIGHPGGPQAARMPQQHGAPMKQERRKGKWTAEEEDYVMKIIELFNLGLLQLPEGTTLRVYLSQALNCDPMRITKKFTGTSCLGKRVYHSAERNAARQEEWDRAQEELRVLERRFKAGLERSKQKDRGILDFDATVLHNRNVVSTPAIDAMVLQNRAQDPHAGFNPQMAPQAGAAARPGDRDPMGMMGGAAQMAHLGGAGYVQPQMSFGGRHAPQAYPMVPDYAAGGKQWGMRPPYGMPAMPYFPNGQAAAAQQQQQQQLQSTQMYADRANAQVLLQPEGAMPGRLGRAAAAPGGQQGGRKGRPRQPGAAAQRDGEMLIGFLNQVHRSHSKGQLRGPAAPASSHPSGGKAEKDAEKKADQSADEVTGLPLEDDDAPIDKAKAAKENGDSSSESGTTDSISQQDSDATTRECSNGSGSEDGVQTVAKEIDSDDSDSPQSKRQKVAP